jgi:hypothetical protein
MSGAASPRWPAGTTAGLARLRANGGEAIRKAVLAEDEAEMASVRAANDSAAIVANSGEEMAKRLAANRAEAEADTAFAARQMEAGARVLARTLAKEGPTVRRSSSRENLVNGSPVIAGQPAPAPKPPAGALSAGAMQVILAVHKVAPDGSWIDQKAIPHGLTGRAVPGYLGGLARRGLVELRADKGGKFSARATAAGVAALAEAGR